MVSYLKIFPLLIVVALLAFGVRLGEFAVGVSHLGGAAMAQDEQAEAQEIPAETEEAIAPDTDQNDAPARLAQADETGEDDTTIWRDASDSDFELDSVRMEMVEDLAERRQELQKRERALNNREALLKAAEQELERKYQELAGIRQEIQGLLKEQSEAEQQRIRSLVKIYEGMKSKQAARIFDTLDLDILVNVMTQMSERKVAPILAEMNPERARTVTILMAEQKKLPELPGSN